MGGTFGKVNGVAITTTGGALWKSYNTNSSGLDAATFPVRYASFPSDNTWYVTHGAFPQADDDGGQQKDDDPFNGDEESELVAELSERISIWKNKNGEHKFKYRNVKEHGTYTAAISKTTDGGQTFTKLFEDQGNFYLNGIHCSDETHCVAVGEGADGGHIYTTTDGQNFLQTNTEPGASCMDVRFVGPQEVWAACGLAKSQLQIESHFWHSTDGGQSWSNVVLPGGMPTALDMTSPTDGWATIIKPTQQCGIAKFTATAPTPPPTPPPSPRARARPTTVTRSTARASLTRAT